jgi:voltage-gated potassium channel
VRLHDLGARVVLRPIRSYPEIVVRSMVAPGSEAILEDFFTHDGDHPQRYSVELEGVRWSDIICALATNDMGVALGYVNDEDYVIPNPPAATLVTTTAIIVLVRETAEPRESEIRHCIDSYQAGRENTTGLRPAA